LIALAKRHANWVLGFQDETWWSRLAQPNLHAWTDSDKQLRLLQKHLDEEDPDPKALACYGLLASCSADPESMAEQIWLRFVDGRPISEITIQFLSYCCKQVQAAGKTVLLMIWDNASWHISHQVVHWIRQHNRQVKQNGDGVRILACLLPTKSPWLNPIEPHWRHAKRCVSEPARVLSSRELTERICSYFGCDVAPQLSINQNVS
jgi:transposase